MEVPPGSGRWTRYACDACTQSRVSCSAYSDDTGKFEIPCAACERRNTKCVFSPKFDKPPKRKLPGTSKNGQTKAKGGRGKGKAAIGTKKRNEWGMDDDDDEEEEAWMTDGDSEEELKPAKSERKQMKAALEASSRREDKIASGSTSKPHERERDSAGKKPTNHTSSSALPGQPKVVPPHLTGEPIQRTDSTDSRGAASGLKRKKIRVDSDSEPSGGEGDKKKRRTAKNQVDKDFVDSDLSDAPPSARLDKGKGKEAEAKGGAPKLKLVLKNPQPSASASALTTKDARSDQQKKDGKVETGGTVTGKRERKPSHLVPTEGGGEDDSSDSDAEERRKRKKQRAEEMKAAEGRVNKKPNRMENSKAGHDGSSKTEKDKVKDGDKGKEKADSSSTPNTALKRPLNPAHKILPHQAARSGAATPQGATPRPAGTNTPGGASTPTGQGQARKVLKQPIPKRPVDVLAQALAGMTGETSSSLSGREIAGRKDKRESTIVTVFKSELMDERNKKRNELFAKTQPLDLMGGRGIIAHMEQACRPSAIPQVAQQMPKDDKGRPKSLSVVSYDSASYLEVLFGSAN